MANSQLDHYIETLEGRLQSLPSTRRQEEMQEVRQHLEALAAGHRLAGLNEDEAVEAAIHQFGHAEQVGQELGKISQQRRVRIFWLFGVYILTVAVNLIIFTINESFETWFATLVMAFSLSSGVLALGVIELVQNYSRSRKKQTRAE